MTERYRNESQGPYYKDKFTYNSETDSYTCPHGQQLTFRGMRRSKLSGLRSMRVYYASRTSCHTCSALGICTRDKRAGRSLWITPYDELLRKHRQWMDTNEARTLYARRKEMSESTFGILKEQMNARRFLLRGLTNVRAEFTLLATAFNLRTLWRIWSKLGRSINQAKIKIADRLALPYKFTDFSIQILGSQPF